MKFLVINGVNLNMLGTREKALYGERDYASLEKFIFEKAGREGVFVECFQSNHEGDIVEKIQSSYGNFEGIIINAGAYTHTSIAILDALKAVDLPTVEVHLTNVSEREEFRKFSFISLHAFKIIKGKGFDGYAEAIEVLKNHVLLTMSN